MSWLVDTNVVSEWRLSPRDPGVIAWLDATEPFVTRNVKHFAPLGVVVLNRWSGG